jgi:hypothetical protein
MYPRAAAARFANCSFGGSPAAIDAEQSRRKVTVTSSSSTYSLMNSFSRRARTFQSSCRRSSPRE